MRVFRRDGYAGASLDALCAATGLKRGSLYAAYPDKRALFLAVLRDYAEQTVGVVERTLAAADDPVAGITQVLRRAARNATDGEGRHGCLLTNTAAELAGRDAEIRAEVGAAFARLEAAFSAAVARGRAQGRIDGDVASEALGGLFVAVVQGLRVLGKSGAEPAALDRVVDGALAALGPRRDG
jgi:TetR/AcrR family transcriptional repressor of nem operon